ncbi:MAG: glycosyltransferase family protein [Candidatus Omnitrophica bacterium]|nr:glycosyltransferase family protein [Candidatus Omnitrophota bacterium]
MRTLSIVQARMGSTRLPGKTLLKIKGKPMIVHGLERLKKCRLIDHIILATSNLKEDRVLLDTARKLGIEGFAGNEQDVLDRYWQVARPHNPEAVVRCTGDCPLLDPFVTDQVIEQHFKNKKDYTSNTLTRSFPRGYDTEVFRFSALERAAREAREPFEREHVTPYIFGHPEIFSLDEVIAKPAYHAPGLRLTVDTKEDFEFISAIFNGLYDKNPFFGVKEVMSFLAKNPKLTQINTYVQQKPMIVPDMK